ncbi:MAG: hypothetical protein U1F66_12060 [bacterium]
MPSNRLPRRLLGLTAALLLTAACAKTPPQSAVDAARAAQLDQALAAFSRRQDKAGPLSAYAQVTLRAGGRKELFDAALLAIPPSRLLIQILDDLGQERARFVADGSWVLFYDAQKNRYSRLPQDAESLRKTLKLPVSVEDLIARLLQQVPPGGSLGWNEVASAAGGSYRALRSGDRVLWAQDPPRLIAYEALSPSGKLQYRVDYQAQEMSWSFRRPKAELTLRFQSFERARPVPEGRFDTEPPPDAIPE